MNPLTQQHRAQQLLIRRATVAQFERLWPALEWARLDATYPALAVRAATLVTRNRETSAGVAAEYLRLMRREAGVRSPLRISFAEAMAAEELSAVLHSTSVAPIKAAAARGAAPDVAMASALSLAAGAVTRLVLNAGRETVTATTTADPAARGWRRVLGGGGCDFCRERAGIRITSSEIFESHGACGCTSEPIYT